MNANTSRRNQHNHFYQSLWWIEIGILAWERGKNVDSYFVFTVSLTRIRWNAHLEGLEGLVLVCCFSRAFALDISLKAQWSQVWVDDLAMLCVESWNGHRSQKH